MGHSPLGLGHNTAAHGLYPHDETVGDLTGWDQENHRLRTSNEPRSRPSSWIERASESMRTSIASISTACLRPDICAGSSSVMTSDPLASFNADMRSNDRGRLMKRLTAQQSMWREELLEPDPMSSFARLAVEQRLQEGLPMPPSWKAMNINPEGLGTRPTMSEFERCTEYRKERDAAHARKDDSPEGTPARLSFSDINEPR